MILGISKTLGLSINETIHEISYINALMYCRAMPQYGDGKGREGDSKAPLFDASKDACNVENFSSEDFDEEEIVRN